MCVRGTLRRDEPGSVRYVRLDCGRLACRYCGPGRARAIRLAVGRVAEERKLTRFASLTLDPGKLRDDWQSVDYLRHVWAKWRVYLGRRYESVSFVAIVQLHESGIAHLHLLLSRYIPQDWISETWSAVGGGRVVDIRYVDVHRVSVYVSRYLTRDIMLSVPSRKKRISTSRDIVLFARREPAGWCFGLDPIEFYYRNVTGCLVDVREDGQGLKAFTVLYEAWEGSA